MEGIYIGSNRVDLSHLQFADDTLLFCPTNRGVILNLRRMLHCFLVMSGLCINFSKSAVIPFRCARNWID